MGYDAWRMPATATQLPFVREPAARVGGRVFRKQVLPIATVEHPLHGNLHFTPERLKAIAERFHAGAMDQTPFVLVDGATNAHSSDPERYRGEIKGVELAEDGLYATVETTDRGAALLADNPRLPVSVRLQIPEAGPFKGQEILEHLAGTPNPVARGLKPWEAIDASENTEVLDFSDRGAYSALVVAPPEAPKQDDPVLTDDERSLFQKLAQKFGAKPPEPAATPPADPPVTPPADPPVTPPVGESAEDRATRELLESLELPPPPTAPPVTASLSAEDQARLDMAVQRAEASEVRLGKADLSRRLTSYVDAGVPPAMVNAARSALIGDTDEHKALAIDFANGREPAPAKALFAALDAAKGTIDFAEHGTTFIDPESDAAKQAREDAEAAVKRYV